MVTSWEKEVMRRGRQRSWQCYISSPGSCLPSLFALCLFLELYLSCIYSEMHVHHLKMLVSNSNPELECGASFRVRLGARELPSQARPHVPTPRSSFHTIVEASGIHLALGLICAKKRLGFYTSSLQMFFLSVYFCLRC